MTMGLARSSSQWLASAFVLFAGSACSSSDAPPPFHGDVNWEGLTGTIAFQTSVTNLGLLRTSGREAVERPTFDGAVLWNASVALSPDGRRIAYAAFRFDYKNGYEVFVMNTDGSAVRRVSQSAGHAFSPAWSSDGSELFYLDGSSGCGGVTSVRLDGDVVTALPFGSCHGVAPSPNGDRFALAAVKGSGAGIGIGGIRIVSRDGTELAGVPSDEGTFPMSPTWSSDGSRVAFVSRHGPNDGSPPYYFDIGLIDLTHQNARTTVIHWPFDQYALDPHTVFSPDGDQLMFDGWTADSGPDLYRIRLDGSGLTKVTSGGASGASWVR